MNATEKAAAITAAEQKLEEAKTAKDNDRIVAAKAELEALKNQKTTS